MWNIDKIYYRYYRIYTIVKPIYYRKKNFIRYLFNKYLTLCDHQIRELSASQMFYYRFSWCYFASLHHGRNNWKYLRALKTRLDFKSNACLKRGLSTCSDWSFKRDWPFAEEVNIDSVTIHMINSDAEN